MVIARKQQVFLIMVLLSSALLVLCAFLLLTGALGTGLRELHSEFILASMYKFC